jgi:hypothetical protein
LILVRNLEDCGRIEILGTSQEFLIQKNSEMERECEEKKTTHYQEIERKIKNYIENSEKDQMTKKGRKARWFNITDSGEIVARKRSTEEKELYDKIHFVKHLQCEETLKLSELKAHEEAMKQKNSSDSPFSVEWIDNAELEEIEKQDWLWQEHLLSPFSDSAKKQPIPQNKAQDKSVDLLKHYNPQTKTFFKCSVYSPSNRLYTVDEIMSNPTTEHTLPSPPNHFSLSQSLSTHNVSPNIISKHNPLHPTHNFTTNNLSAISSPEFTHLSLADNHDLKILPRFILTPQQPSIQEEDSFHSACSENISASQSSEVLDYDCEQARCQCRGRSLCAGGQGLCQCHCQCQCVSKQRLVVNVCPSSKSVCSLHSMKTNVSTASNTNSFPSKASIQSPSDQIFDLCHQQSHPDLHHNNNHIHNIFHSIQINSLQFE